MKTIFFKCKLTLLALVILIVTSSCSEDSIIKEPTVNYPETTLNATFFKAGSMLEEPIVNWNGNQGKFSLLSSTTGLSINETTGVLEWSKKLPIGIHKIKVSATNSAGKTTISLVLNNPLQGVFTGVYFSSMGTRYFEIEFKSDETLIVKANNAPNIATGTWEKNEETIIANYTYDDASNWKGSLSGTLNIDESYVVYEGDWFFDHGVIAGNEGGKFNVNLN